MGLHADEASCEHCRSYFPLLKSFILHIESSHKGTVTDGHVESYKCDLCTVEFDSAVDHGMHSLLHVCGKAPGKEAHLPSRATVDQGGTKESEVASKCDFSQSTSESTHRATRMYTRLLEQKSKNNAGRNAYLSVMGN